MFLFGGSKKKADASAASSPSSSIMASRSPNKNSKTASPPLPSSPPPPPYNPQAYYSPEPSAPSEDLLNASSNAPPAATFGMQMPFTPEPTTTTDARSNDLATSSQFNTFSFVDGNYNKAKNVSDDESFKIKNKELNKTKMSEISEVSVISHNANKMVVRIIGDRGAIHFMTHFRGHETVTDLTIMGPEKGASSDQSIGVEGMYNLVHCFDHLRQLKLEGLKIDNVCGTILADYVGAMCRQLEHIDLWNDGISDETALEIMKYLKVLPQLRYVNLGENPINSEAKLAIRDMVRGTSIKVHMF